MNNAQAVLASNYAAKSRVNTGVGASAYRPLLYKALFILSYGLIASVLFGLAALF